MFIQLIGTDELQELFKKLPDDIKPNVVKRLARKAAAPIRRAAREKAPIGPGTKKRPGGNLKKSIKIGVSKYPRRSKRAGVWVGPNYGRGKYRGPHAHLVSFGTQGRYTKKGAYRGKAMEHKPPLGDFVKEAAEENKGPVLHNMTKDLEKVVQSEMKRRTRRMSRKKFKL